VDGVELQGTFYPSPGGRKDACVLLLHDFDRKGGGHSHEGGWDDLAESLQAEGYAVLSFDFRGFGNSKSVSNDFWNFPHNRMAGRLTPGRELPDAIDYKNFPPDYYPYLVNDVMAARAYLDRRNDAREVNTSNLIVIGAGEGAAVGALWMAAECRLRRDKRRAVPGLLLAPTLDVPEVTDLACGVWLSLSPTLAGRVVPIYAWLWTAGRDFKVPLAFVYGQKDDAAKNLALNCVGLLRGAPGGGPALEYTGPYAVPGTKLSGSRLLLKSLPTQKWILQDYFEPVLDRRGGREWRRREVEKAVYYWSFPRWRPILAKRPGDDLVRPVPLTLFLGP
jgi:pimeloyl-ACP methyl ester carboxylesterase